MATKRSRLCYMQGRGLCCSFPNRFNDVHASLVYIWYPDAYHTNNKENEQHYYKVLRFFFSLWGS